MPAKRRQGSKQGVPGPPAPETVPSETIPPEVLDTWAMPGGGSLHHTTDGPMLVPPTAHVAPDSAIVAPGYDQATGAAVVAGHQVSGFTDQEVRDTVADVRSERDLSAAPYIGGRSGAPGAAYEIP